LLLGISGRERHPVCQLAIETDFEGVLPRAGKRHVEHQDGTSLDVDHAGRRLTKLYGALTPQELAPALIHEADPDGMDADLGSPAAHSKNQVGAGVHRREVGQPHVLEHAEHAELALLIDEGVIGNNGEIKMQFS
jgi:hypothetical protein